MSDSLPFEKVSLEDAKKVLDTTGAREAPKDEEQKDWRWARTFKPPVPLLDTTVAWMARLPPEVRPVDLARCYPRIANRFCEVWARQDECDRYFDSLMVDRRGRRQGFPASVAQELANLRKHFAHPNGSGALWDSSVYRR